MEDSQKKKGGRETRLIHSKTKVQLSSLWDEAPLSLKQLVYLLQGLSGSFPYV